MKLEFDQNYNYIEIKNTPKGIEIILSSKNPDQPRTAIINSVILTENQFKELISDIKFG